MTDFNDLNPLSGNTQGDTNLETSSTPENPKIPTVAPFMGAAAARYAERSTRVAKATALFDTIVLPFPRQIEVLVTLDEVRLAGLEKKGQPQNGVVMLAASRSGKTVACTQYRDYVAAQPGRDPTKMPVVISTLEALGTSRSFYADTLSVFGDRFSTVGTEAKLKERAKKAFQEFGVELLVVDEVQHLASRQSFGRDVTDTLKRFLDDGIVPVAFVGTDDAAALFARSKELNGRLTAPCGLPALDWHHDDDRELFLGFVARLDEAMVEKGVLRQKAGIGAEAIAELLCEASNGIIGQLTAIVKEAVREAVRRDADTFDVDDLAYAVDVWSIPNNFRADNPFLKPRP